MVANSHDLAEGMPGFVCPTKERDLGSELPGLGQIYEGGKRGFGRSDGHQH